MLPLILALLVGLSVPPGASSNSTTGPQSVNATSPSSSRAPLRQQIAGKLADPASYLEMEGLHIVPVERLSPQRKLSATEQKVAKARREEARKLAGKTLLITSGSYDLLNLNGNQELTVRCTLIAKTEEGRSTPLVFYADHPSFYALSEKAGSSRPFRILISKARETPAGNPTRLGSWLEAETVEEPR